jgi:hypothetical protein
MDHCKIACKQARNINYFIRYLLATQNQRHKMLGKQH